MSEKPILEPFDLIRRYAERQGWIPIGYRRFEVGDWEVTVNGTPEEREDVPAWHALVEHTRYVGMLLMHPCGGSVLGFKGVETDFCEAMRRALRERP